MCEQRIIANGWTVQERLSQVEGHLTGGSGAAGAASKKGRAGVLEKNPDDVSSCMFFPLQILLPDM